VKAFPARLISPPPGEPSGRLTLGLAALLLLTVVAQEGAARLAFPPARLAHDLSRLGVVLALAALARAALGRCRSGLAPGGLVSRGHQLRGLAQRSVLLLLFFVLTGTPILFGPERLAVLRPALGVSLVAGGILALAGRATPPGVPAASRRWVRGAAARTALALVPLLAVQALLVARFVHAVGGQLVFSDDHGSFLYRYHMLARTFPRLVSYDPWWNAGVVDDSAVGGGAASVFLLTWPIAYLASLETAYAWFVPVVAILAAPWSVFAAIRLLGLSRGAALAGGLLALAPEEHGFVWLLERGTLPAMLAAALVPLAFALAWRILVLGDRRWATIVGLALVANLGSFWLLFPLMVAPGLVAAGLAGRVKPRGLAVAAAIGVTLLLVNAGWVLDFLRTREVGRLVQTAPSPQLAPAVIWERLVNIIPMTENPVGLILGAAGLCLFPRRLRMPYAVMLAALALAAAIGPQLFPRLELLRLVIPLGFALIPPAAGLVARAIRAGRSGRGGGLGRVLAVTLLLVMGVHLAEAWARYGSQTHRQVGVMPPATRELTRWLRSHTAPDARVLFAGRVVHQYGGHIAYLQPLTGRPMYAGSYYHGDWGGGTIPSALLTDAEALRRRLELLNARYIVVDASDAAWWRQLPRHSWLTLRADLAGIAVYETDIRPTYLIGARGTVAFDYNRLQVQLEAPADSVTLKFRWVDGLAATPPLPLRPREVAPGLSFIEVEPRGISRFEIRYRG
jgi:hypothetical protein